MRFAFLGLALVLFFIWIGAFVMYHVAGFAIHILLLVALILLVVHLVSGREAA
jgi:hypothetical protein